MPDLIKVGILEPRPTHDISLTDNKGNQVGLILTNRLGVRDPKGILEGNMPRTALRTSQGNVGYDDLELPFTAEVQNTMVGGRAQEEFARDRTKYSDAFRMDTTREFPICGPAELSQTGLIPSGNIDNAVDQDRCFSLHHETVMAVSHTMAETKTVYGVTLLLREDALGGTLYYSILDRTAGDPDYGLPPAPSTISAPANYQSSITLLPTVSGYNFKEFFLPITGGIEVAAGDSLCLILYYKANNPTTGIYIPGSLWMGSIEGVTAYSVWSPTMQDGWYEYDDATIFNTIHMGVENNSIFFEYRRQLYAILNSTSKGSAQLFMNGWRGACTVSTALGTLVDSTQTTWADDAAAGCIALIINGKGENEDQPWRKITASADGVLTVSPPWKIGHDTTTEYVVLDSNVWTEIDTAYGEPEVNYLPSAVTDVAIVNDMAVFAMGAANKISYMREHNSTGTWTREFKVDATYYADRLEPIVNEEGDLHVWRAIADGAKVDSSLAGVYSDTTPLVFDINLLEREELTLLKTRAEADLTTEEAKAEAEQDAGYITTLERLIEDYTWQITATAGHLHSYLPMQLVCGSTDSRITNLVAYGTPTIPYIIKEDSIGSILNKIYDEIPVPELKAVRSEDNGIAAMAYGVYLYFSMAGTMIERYYDQRLDDVGPNRAEGLPRIRQGVIRKMIPYPGRYYAAIDAGFEGHSSILCSNELGWHEIYRTDNAGERISDIYIQTIPGDDNTDRLIVSAGTDVIKLPIAINPLNQVNYQYYGYDTNRLPSIETSWIDYGMKDVNKYFHSVTLFADYPVGKLITGREFEIIVSYRLNENDTWKLAGKTRPDPAQRREAGTQFPQEIELDHMKHNVSGKKIQLKFEFKVNSDTYHTPRLKAWVLNGILRMPVKKSWQLTFALEPTKDLQDKKLSDERHSLIDQLNIWANSKVHNTPLTMRSCDRQTDKKLVFIDPASISLINVVLEQNRGNTIKRFDHLAQMTVYEV